MQKALLLPAVLLITLFALPSCKKTSTPAPAKYTGCRIIKIVETPQDTTSKTSYYFYYNNDGTVQRLYAAIGQHNYGGYFKYFDYIGNTMLVRMVYYGETTPYSVDSVTFDAAGRISYIGHTGQYYGGYYNQQYDQYEYDNGGDMIAHLSSSYGNGEVDSFQWVDGDPISFVEYSNGGYMNTEYYGYSSVVYNTGNITARTADLELYGRAIYTPKHLMITDASSSSYDTTKYSYVLDTAGKVTLITQVQPGGYVNTTQIVYACE